MIDNICSKLIKAYKAYDSTDGDPTASDVAKIYKDIAGLNSSQLERFETLIDMVLEYQENI